MFKQRDIVIVKFPFTDGSQFKKRPALVISNRRLDKTEDVLLIQITSKIHTDDLSLIINDNDCSKSLPLKSYIRIHKIFTVHQSLILFKISEVNPDFLKVVSTKNSGSVRNLLIPHPLAISGIIIVTLVFATHL